MHAQKCGIICHWHSSGNLSKCERHACVPCIDLREHTRWCHRRPHLCRAELPNRGRQDRARRDAVNSLSLSRTLRSDQCADCTILLLTGCVLVNVVAPTIDVENCILAPWSDIGTAMFLIVSLRVSRATCYPREVKVSSSRPISGKATSCWCTGTAA